MPKVKRFKETIGGMAIDVQINVDSKTGAFHAILPAFMREKEDVDVTVSSKDLVELENRIRYKVKEYMAEAESTEAFIRVEFALSGVYQNRGAFDVNGFSSYTDSIKLLTTILMKEVNSISKRVTWYTGRLHEGKPIKSSQRLSIHKDIPSGTIIPWNPHAYQTLKNAEYNMKKISEKITEVLSQEPDALLQTLIETKSLGSGN